MEIDETALGNVLAARIAELEAAVERLGSFAFEPGGSSPRPAAGGEGERLETARELMLRALRAAGDPVGHVILRRLAEGDAPVEELASLVSLTLLAAWERVNDLVQSGLAGRTLEGNRAGLTPLGRALFDLVEETVRAAAERG